MWHCLQLTTNLRRARAGAFLTLVTLAAAALAACTVTFNPLPGTPTPLQESATPTAMPIPAVITATPLAQATALPAPISATATPLPQIVLLPTNVQFALALENVNIRQGPATAYPVVGRLAAGQMAEVLHATDNGWWHVPCPSAEIAGDCFVSADPALTQPSGSPVSVPSEAQPDLDTPGVIGADVQWVLTRAALPAFTGPASRFPQAGGVAAGAVVRVLGTTTDGAWWRIPCPGNEAEGCFINAAFATPTVAPDEQQFATVPTDVQLVQAQVDVPIYEGPGSSYLPAGLIFAGMSARVLGVTPDNGWWLIACEQTTARWCFISADPAQAVPVGQP